MEEIKIVTCVNPGYTGKLTKNKDYPVISETENFYEVISNDGDIISSTKSRFIKKQQEAVGTETRKIIGYKCPMDLYNGKVEKGTLFTAFTKAAYCFPEGSPSSYSLPLEIVKAWEPVYEQEKKVLFLSIQGVDLKIFKGGIISIDFKGKSTITAISDLRELLDTYMVPKKLEGRIASYSVEILAPSVKIGCDSEGRVFSPAEIFSIIAQYEQFFNIKE